MLGMVTDVGWLYVQLPTLHSLRFINGFSMIVSYTFATLSVIINVYQGEGLGLSVCTPKCQAAEGLSAVLSVLSTAQDTSTTPQRTM